MEEQTGPDMSASRLESHDRVSDRRSPSQWAFAVTNLVVPGSANDTLSWMSKLASSDNPTAYCNYTCVRSTGTRCVSKARHRKRHESLVSQGIHWIDAGCTPRRNPTGSQRQ